MNDNAKTVLPKTESLTNLLCYFNAANYNHIAVCPKL